MFVIDWISKKFLICLNSLKHQNHETKKINFDKQISNIFWCVICFWIPIDEINIMIYYSFVVAFVYIFWFKTKLQFVILQIEIKILFGY